MAPLRPRVGSQSALHLLSAAMVVASAAYAVYPGWYSFDSAHQLQQAVQGRYSDLQPPAMALAWAGLLALGLPPGSLLVANVLMAAIGLALIGRSLRGYWGLLLPLLLLWPPFLVLFGHLWSDVSLAAVLLLAAGLLAEPAPGRGALVLATLLLFVAVALRHNAAPAALPLLALAIARWPGGPRRIAARLAIVGLLTTLALWGSTALSRAVTDRQVPSWSPTAVWDLAAASIDSGELLLPAGTHGPAMTVDELREYMDHDMALGLWMRVPSGINIGIAAPLPAGVERELLRRWLALPLTHTEAWLAHRARVAWSLFGPQRAEKPDELFIVPQVVVLEGNPAIAANATAVNRALVDGLRAQKPTAWIAPIGYLALALLGVAVVLRARRWMATHVLAVSLAAAAWLYAAPLVLVAPSAEWRYALWPMLASVLAFLLAVLPATHPPSVRSDL